MNKEKQAKVQKAINKMRFPDYTKLIESMMKQDLHFMPWESTGIKDKHGNDICVGDEIKINII